MVFQAAPFQSKEKGHDGGDEGDGAGGIQLRELGLGGQLGLLAIGDAQEQDDDGQSNAAEGQVDVEAPAPRNVGREGAADEGAQDGGDAEDGAGHALVEGALVQRHGVHDDDDAAGEDAGRPDALDGAADDEGHGARGGAAQGGPDLEQHDGDGVDGADGIEAVQLAEQQLEGGRGEQVGGAVPADVGQRVEFVGDGGNGRGDDQAVERDEEDGNIDRRQHERETQPRRVLIVGLGGGGGLGRRELGRGGLLIGVVVIVPVPVVVVVVVVIVGGVIVALLIGLALV